MKKVLMPVAEGFEEIEAITIIDVLRRAGIEVTVAGLGRSEIIGAHKIKILPDAALDSVKDKDFDMLVLPGGMPGVDNLRKDARVLSLVKKMKEKNKPIGAICAAPLVLRDAGLTSGLRLTCYPGFDTQIPGGKFEKDRVVTDGNIITSKGPGTALEFSLKIVEMLIDKSKAQSLAEAMVVSR